jgi:hypothetical protein
MSSSTRPAGVAALAIPIIIHLFTKPFSGRQMGRDAFAPKQSSALIVGAFDSNSFFCSSFAVRFRPSCVGHGPADLAGNATMIGDIRRRPSFWWTAVIPWKRGAPVSNFAVARDEATRLLSQ